MIAGFIQLCAATPAINNALQGRIYEDVMPRGYTLPCAVVHGYDGSQDYDFNGPLTIREDGVQFDVYAATGDEARAIVDTLRLTLGSFVGTLPDGTVVQACYVQRAMSLPFVTGADKSSTTRRHMIGFHVVSQQ